jgi:RyR domain
VLIDQDLVEQLARAIHARYLAEQTTDGRRLGENRAMVAWDDLDEDKREANRAQARDITAKLERIGCAVGTGTDPTFAFTPEELESLARDEHERWMAQRRQAGWRRGRRDDATKRHPGLVPYDRLSRSDKDKDRDAVRHIPDVLAEVGLRVIRL